MIHAFELGILSEQEKDRFELHVLECPYCFEQLKSFGDRVRVLTTSPDIRNLLSADPGGTGAEVSWRSRLARLLWPESTPVILRPALLLLVCLLLT